MKTARILESSFSYMFELTGTRHPAAVLASGWMDDLDHSTTERGPVLRPDARSEVAAVVGEYGEMKRSWPMDVCLLKPFSRR
jgi:hypothetical protein